MNTEYLKARDEKCKALLAEYYDDHDVLDPEFHLREAADWGRAYESPAVKAMRQAIELALMYEPYVDKYKIKHTAYPKLLEAMRAYDAERAGSGEK